VLATAEGTVETIVNNKELLYAQSVSLEVGTDD